MTQMTGTSKSAGHLNAGHLLSANQNARQVMPGISF
jgi:hypothetical protein